MLAVGISLWTCFFFPLVLFFHKQYASHFACVFLKKIFLVCGRRRMIFSESLMFGSEMHSFAGHYCKRLPQRVGKNPSFWCCIADRQLTNLRSCQSTTVEFDLNFFRWSVTSLIFEDRGKIWLIKTDVRQLQHTYTPGTSRLCIWAVTNEIYACLDEMFHGYINQTYTTLQNLKCQLGHSLFGQIFFLPW